MAALRRQRAACQDIAGATDDTYLLTAADVGSQSRLLVTAINAWWQDTAMSAPTSAVVVALPANGSLPTITGTARVGQALTADHGAWTGTGPLTFDYQWKRCDTAGGTCQDIPGATSAQLTLVDDDIDMTIRVRVVATGPGGTGGASSAPTAAVAPNPPAVTSAPSVTGPTRDGLTLSAHPGSWTGRPGFSYQWRRCDAAGGGCASIDGAADSTYTLRGADVGSTIRVRVLATNTAGNASADSAATAPIDAAPPASSGGAAVQGQPREGQALSIGRGDWAGTRRWRSRIAGSAATRRAARARRSRGRPARRCSSRALMWARRSAP